MKIKWHKTRRIKYSFFRRKYLYQEVSAGFIFGGSVERNYSIINGKEHVRFISRQASYDPSYSTFFEGNSLFSLRKGLRKDFVSKIKKRENIEENRKRLIEIFGPEITQFFGEKYGN